MIKSVENILKSATSIYSAPISNYKKKKSVVKGILNGLSEFGKSFGSESKNISNFVEFI